MILAFADCELDPERWVLTRRGTRVEVQPKALGLLLYLARHRERAVSRDELLEKLWPDAVVSEDALSHALKKARQAVGDDGQSQRVIQTVRRVGARFVAPLEEREAPVAPEEPVPGATPAAAEMRAGTRPLFLIGREAELARLAAALEGALAGHGQVLLLTGEAGIGKTRLAEAAAAQARARGFEVRVGCAYERLGAPAFWLWIQILEEFVREWSPEALAEALGSRAAQLAQLVPELAERLPGLPPLPTADPEVARFPLFRAVVRFLTEAARQRPLVLILEDLQWADTASMRLLEMLLGALRGSRLLLIGTYRDEQVGPEHPLNEMLAELWRQAAGETIQLAGLSRAEVGRLLEAKLEFAPPPALAVAIHERTQGNPFFVTQVLHTLEAEGRLSASDTALPLVELEAWLAEIPLALQNVLDRRLARLAKGTRLLLVVASLTRDEFDVKLLEHVSGLPHEMLLDDVDEAARARVIEEVPGVVGRYRFVHALLQSACSAGMSAVRRAELHATIGEALEELYQANPEPHLGELAHHFLRALPAGDPERALDYAERAGRAAHARTAYDEAADFFARALGVIEGLPGAGAVRRYDLWMARARALIVSGNRREMRRSYSEALAAARELGDTELLAHAALGLGIPLEMAPVEGLVPALEEAVAGLVDQETPLRALVMARLAAWLSTEPAAHARAEQLMKDALALAGRLGDAEAQGHALMTWVMSHRLWGLPDPEERLAASTEMIGLAEASDDPFPIMFGHFLRTDQLLELGDFAAADAEHAAASARAEESHLRLFEADALVYRSTRRLLEGRLNEAEALGREALAEGTSYFLALYRALLFAVRREQARLGELEATAQATVDLFPRLALPRSVLAFIYEETGRREEARREVEALAADDFGCLAGHESWRCAAAVLSELCGRFGDRKRAAVLTRLLERHEPYWCFAAGGGVCFGPVALHLGMLATARADWDQAEPHLTAATARTEALGAPVWAARARLAHARMLRARRRKGDRTAAREQLGRAAATARELGLVRLLAEIEEVADVG